MTSAAGWQPKSEAEIEEAIRLGDLKENRHLDVKREVGTSDSSRKETARDIASLAIAGGALLIGVEEQPKDHFNLHPLSLDGEAERLEQIAANRVDPPVLVTTREIACDSAPGLGYLWVEVPPSGLAPHMVDNVYWGRADKTKARLTDSQVLLLHSRRESHETHIDLLLNEEVQRDPVESKMRRYGHLYLVAWPIQAGKRAALPALADRDPYVRLRPIIDAAESELDHRTREFAPRPTYAHSLQRRADGVAFTSLGGVENGRRLESGADESNALDIEFREDGGIRIFMGRMTADYGSDRVITEGLAVAYARRLIHWSAGYGALWNYTGSWGLGVAANGLSGLYSSAFRDHHDVGPAYDKDEYRSVTVASTQDLKQQPWAVAELLIGRLVRGLGTATYYSADLQAPHAGS